jgi:hypothetical protein
MNIQTSGYIAALMLGAAAFAGPAAAQLKGVGGGGGAPHVGGGGAGTGAHSSFGGAGVAAHPSLGGAGIGTHSIGSGAFAARNTGTAPLITGRSVAAPNAFGGAAATPSARFAGRPGFNPGFRNHHRFWPYAAAAAGAGIAYGVGTYGYDYPYDTGYYDPGYDVAPVAPAATSIDEGGSCATPVLVCRLYEPAPIGYGCSCTIGGGQARGVVQP